MSRVLISPHLTSDRYCVDMSTRRYQIRSSADIGRTVAEARRQRGLTQAQLAETSRVERTYLAKLEAGHTVKQIDRLLSLLRTLGVELYATQEQADG
jgi:ribosome-binding protein aMBF1 (putative translation factor)